MDDNTEIRATRPSLAEYKKMKETLDEVIKILYFYRPQNPNEFDGSIEAMDTIEAVIDRYMADGGSLPPTD